MASIESGYAAMGNAKVSLAHARGAIALPDELSLWPAAEPRILLAPKNSPLFATPADVWSLMLPVILTMAVSRLGIKQGYRSGQHECRCKRYATRIQETGFRRQVPSDSGEGPDAMG
jgi:hypothetical protein